jgi:hypothetical protein
MGRPFPLWRQILLFLLTLLCLVGSIVELCHCQGPWIVREDSFHIKELAFLVAHYSHEK